MTKIVEISKTLSLPVPETIAEIQAFNRLDLPRTITPGHLGALLCLDNRGSVHSLVPGDDSRGVFPPPYLQTPQTIVEAFGSYDCPSEDLHRAIGTRIGWSEHLLASGAAVTSYIDERALTGIADPEQRVKQVGHILSTLSTHPHVRVRITPPEVLNADPWQRVMDFIHPDSLHPEYPSVYTHSALGNPTLPPTREELTSYLEAAQDAALSARDSQLFLEQLLNEEWVN